MQSTQSSVIRWWETRATSLPRELPTWSLLTTPSQGISWLNRPHTHLTHARTRTLTQAPTFQILTRSSFIREPGLWAWIKDLDHCFVMLAELTKGRTNCPEHKKSLWCAGTKKSLIWYGFNVAFSRVINSIGSFLSYFHVVAWPACVRAFLNIAHTGFLLAILDQTQVSVGFISTNPFPDEVAAYQMTFSLVAPMLTFMVLPWNVSTTIKWIV